MLHAIQPLVSITLSGISIHHWFRLAWLWTNAKCNWPRVSGLQNEKCYSCLQFAMQNALCKPVQRSTHTHTYLILHFSFKFDCRFCTQSNHWLRSSHDPKHQYIILQWLWKKQKCHLQRVSLLQHANAKYDSCSQFAIQNDCVVWLVAPPHCRIPCLIWLRTQLLVACIILIIITIIISVIKNALIQCCAQIK